MPLIAELRILCREQKCKLGRPVMMALQEMMVPGHEGSCGNREKMRRGIYFEGLFIVLGCTLAPFSYSLS